MLCMAWLLMVRCRLVRGMGWLLSLRIWKSSRGRWGLSVSGYRGWVLIRFGFPFESCDTYSPAFERSWHVRSLLFLFSLLLSRHFTSPFSCEGLMLWSNTQFGLQLCLHISFFFLNWGWNVDATGRVSRLAPCSLISTRLHKRIQQMSHL
jgi:hypothetical protein